MELLHLRVHSGLTRPQSVRAQSPIYFLSSISTKPHSTEVSSVVVTWEDHPLAANARAKDERMEEEQDTEEGVEVGESYVYQVQVWVSGWGLDALWNPANRRVSTRDPFLVLLDLPLEHELKFRIRVKAKQTKTSVLGFLLPIGFFSTEIDGPWSDVVTLSTSRDDELEAIVAFLTGNKPFFLLLAMCIGSGCVIVAQLYFRRRLARSQQQKQLEKLLSLSETDVVQEGDEAETTMSESVDTGKTAEELKHEIRDLRQELADSEDEVRQLMLFSGYGIESLAPQELEKLERELKNTLKRVQHLKKHGAPESVMSKTVNGLDGDEQRRREREVRHKKRAARHDALPMSPIYEHRSL
ncbi:hypothetical protein BBO99_00008379 [Phytophthora kernoviae]|uniref:K-box domain-containing protein n=2 Tax=Phytophthora kernoviae TaxID=325452 RepID=A0A3R7IMA2_9STRA|nr:hypothetical protein G195_010048 [Phytophthora kernoviae 00238/432]KAG2510444.1 hypothetical protein JM16_008537 [Phytophthora kernoviae]KAG2512445.1 hypothetical protein JM18_008556 [Phytophthora kernoviae]RLN37102.1 hypothetical protein BBI17_008311 [Phytophthora kernoviae]RLN75383.1 hypothetical protein BBO99_00008379 [Phytophthora kernoviae]